MKNEIGKRKGNMNSTQAKNDADARCNKQRQIESRLKGKIKEHNSFCSLRSRAKSKRALERGFPLHGQQHRDFGRMKRKSSKRRLVEDRFATKDPAVI